MYKATTTLRSKNINSKTSGSIEFKITFYFNEHGIIYNWKTNVMKLSIKVGSQPTWIRDKSTIFKMREELFKGLGIKQVSTKVSTEVKVISGDKIRFFEEFINSRKTFKSTLKTIDALVRGNNWSGTFADPNASNLLSNDFEPGTIMLLNDLVVFDERSIDILDMQCEEKDINFLFNLEPELRKLYDYVNKKKDSGDLQHFKGVLSKYKAKFVKTTKELDKLIRTERSKYGSNVDKYYSKFPFSFVNKKQFQKAHIYDVHRIKDKIVKVKSNSGDWSDLLMMVSDPENFLPLPEHAHREFDKDNFTYTIDGYIWAANESGHNFIEEFLEEKFKRIPSVFMTKEKVDYFNMRNSYIDFDQQ